MKKHLTAPAVHLHRKALHKARRWVHRSTFLSALALAGVAAHAGCAARARLYLAFTDFASSATTIDLTRLVPEPLLPNDKFWHHTTGSWWFDIGALLVLSACYLGFVRWRIRLKS